MSWHIFCQKDVQTCTSILVDLTKFCEKDVQSSTSILVDPYFENFLPLTKTKKSKKKRKEITTEVLSFNLQDVCKIPLDTIIYWSYG